MTYTDTVIRRIQRAESERVTLKTGFGQDVGACRSCYWLLERAAFKPWCQLYDHVAGAEKCAGYFFIEPDGEV